MEFDFEKVGSILDKVKRKSKVKKALYKDAGKIPIIDQGERLIAGFTDNEDYLFSDVPITVFGDHTRRLKFITFSFACGADGTQLLKAKKEYDQRFFFYALSNLKLKNYGYERHFKYIKEENIPKPNIDIQRKIAQILSNYDYLIENNTKRIELLEKMTKLIYEEWFVKFKFPGHEKIKLIDSKKEFGKIPDGWEVESLNEILETIKGLGYKGDSVVENGGSCFVNLKTLNRGGGFRYDGLKRYTGDYKERHEIKEGDIIMAVTDMTQNREIVGRVARIPKLNEDKIIISMDLIKIIPKKDINYNWLYSFFRFSGFGDKIKHFANGVNVLHLDPEVVKKQEIILPKKEVRNSFAEKIAPIYNMIDFLELKNQNLRKTRDLLLPKLISGEIDVSNLSVKIDDGTTIQEI